MELFKKSVQGIANTVIGALSHEEPGYTKDEVKILEEQERSRRAQHPAQEKQSRDNAANISALIKNVRQPHFKGSSQGYKRVTRRHEENERKRRMGNKVECYMRQFAARRVASNIRSLGWPFYKHDLHNGAEYIFPSKTAMAEEDERRRRINSPSGILTAKNNASIVANLIRWENFRKPSNTGFKKHTKAIEEKERTRRLRDAESALRSCANASQVSQLIAQLGWPFYVTQHETYQKESLEYTKGIEESERKRRLVHPAEEQRAREHAHDVSDLLPLGTRQASEKNFLNSSAEVSDKVLEEQERGRRISDRKGEKQASRNAKKISSLVSALKKPLRRLSSSQSMEQSKRVSRDDMVPPTMTTSFDDFIPEVVAEYAIEVFEEPVQVLSAQRVVFEEPAVFVEPQMVAAAPVFAEPQYLMSEVYAEPQVIVESTPIVTVTSDDSPTIQVQPLTTTTVSTFPSTVSYEVYEPSYNALNRSSSSYTPVPLEGLSGPSARSALNGLPEKRINPTVVHSLPSSKRAGLASDKPISATNSPAIYPLKFTNAVASYSPVTQRTLLRAVSLPAAALSLDQRTFSGSSNNSNTLPEDYRPMSPTFTPDVPHVLSPIFTPMLLEPVLPSATLATASALSPQTKTMQRSVSTSFVPAETSSFNNRGVHRLTDKERKRLEKEAVKHNKQAAKEARRAENQLTKAQKYFNRGKDARAKKLETKAEQHNIASRAHQTWAQELSQDTVATSLQSNYGRAVM